MTRRLVPNFTTLEENSNEIILVPKINHLEELNQDPKNLYAEKHSVKPALSSCNVEIPGISQPGNYMYNWLTVYIKVYDIFPNRVPQ